MNNKELINYQTGEALDWDEVRRLKHNAMLKSRPELWCEWDFEKNNKLRLNVWKASRGMSIKAWWICEKEHEWEQYIYRRTKGRDCPYCSGVRVLPENSLVTLNPELASEWHTVKNGELTPHDVTRQSNRRVWWKCELGHEWDAIISNRNNGGKCPYCSPVNRKLNNFNRLSTNSPELTKEWHPTKNGDLSPHTISRQSNERVWWIGECGHEWDATIASRFKGGGCPYCTGYNARILKGFNDMWTTNAKQAELLVNPDDGYKYTQSSGKKVDWKCPCCGEIYNKRINLVNRSGLYCSKCKEKTTFHLKIKAKDIKNELEKP